MDERVELIEGEESKDSMGAVMLMPSATGRKTVYAEIKSIGMNEYWQAMALDKVPDIKLAVYIDEYAEEPFVAYAGKTYRVQRTYMPGNERIELTCRKV